MVEGQILGAEVVAAVLALEGVAQEDIESGEGRTAVQADVLLQRDHAGQPHLEAGRADDGVVLGDDVHAVEEHRLMASCHDHRDRSEEHTSELQSLMRISYAVFCLKKKK